jgi:hypothetical protein
MADNEDLSLTSSMLPDQDFVDWMTGKSPGVSSPSLLREAHEKATGGKPTMALPATSKAQSDKMSRIWAMDPDSREAYFKKAPGDRKLFEADTSLMLSQTFPGEMSYEKPGHDFSLDMSREPDTPGSPVYYDPEEADKRYTDAEEAAELGSSSVSAFFDATGSDMMLGDIPLVHESYGPPGESWQSRGVLPEEDPSGPMSIMPTEQIQSLMQQTGLSEEVARDALAQINGEEKEPGSVQAESTEYPSAGYMDFANMGDDQWNALMNAFELNKPFEDYKILSGQAFQGVQNLATREGEFNTIKEQYKGVARTLFGNKEAPQEIDGKKNPEYMGVMGQLEAAKHEKNLLDSDLALHEVEKARSEKVISNVIAAETRNLWKDYAGPGGKLERGEAFLDSALEEIQSTGQSFWQQFDPFPDGWEGEADWGNIGRVGLALTSLATLIGGTALNVISQGKIPNFGLPLFQLALDKASEGMMTGYRQADAANTIIGRMESILGSRRAAIGQMELKAYEKAAKHFEQLAAEHRGKDEVKANAYQIAHLELQQKHLEKKEQSKRELMNIVMTEAELNAKTGDAAQSYYNQKTHADIAKMQSILAYRQAAENSKEVAPKPEFSEDVVEARTKVLDATNKFKSTLRQLIDITQDNPGTLEQFLTMAVSDLTDKFDMESDEYQIWKSLHMQSQIIGQYMARGFDTGNLSEWEQKFWREIVNPTNPGTFSVKNLIGHMYIFEQDRRGQVHRMWSYMNSADKARFAEGIKSTWGGDFLGEHEKWRQSVKMLSHGAEGVAGSGVPYTGAKPALHGTEAWDILGFDTNLFDGETPEDAWERELARVTRKGKEPGYYQAPKGKGAGLNSLRVQANSRDSWAKTNKLVPVSTRVPGVKAYLPKEVADAFTKFQEAAKAAGHNLQLDGALAGGRSERETESLSRRHDAGEKGVFKVAKHGTHTEHGGFTGIDISVGMPSRNSKKTPLFLWARDNAAKHGFKYKAHNHHFDYVGFPKRKSKKKDA